MNSTIIEDVSEILDTFHLGEISELIEEQVNLYENSYTYMADYFKPIHHHYQKITECDENSDEMKQEATDRFHDVCRIFISAISKKYNLAFNEEWFINHEGDLPGFTYALYCFFVKDIASNIQEVCINYINKNEKEIYKFFEERKNKKDSITLLNKKKYSVEMAVILANIYDVTTWIISQLSEEQYIQYMNQDHIPVRVIYPMLQDDTMSGDFMDAINELYTENLNLRAEICYQILSSFNVIEKS